MNELNYRQFSPPAWNTVVVNEFPWLDRPYFRNDTATSIIDQLTTHIVIEKFNYRQLGLHSISGENRTETIWIILNSDATSSMRLRKPKETVLEYLSTLENNSILEVAYVVRRFSGLAEESLYVYIVEDCLLDNVIAFRKDIQNTLKQLITKKVVDKVDPDAV